MKANLRPTGRPAVELLRYSDAQPTFIVGSVRSGTSAMMHALREGAGIPGFNEGNLAQLMPVLLAAVDQHYAHAIQKPSTMVGSVSREYVSTSIKNVFGRAFIDTMGAGRWLDKSPGGAAIIAACPVLLDIFPKATFILCKRRGVENVLSRQRKYPDLAFDQHCRAWTKTMEAWLEVGPQLGRRAIEVDQRDMATRPGFVADKVSRLLELSPEQHEGFLDVLRKDRVQQTRPIQDETPIGLGETGWSDGEQETFRRLCGPMMEAFGYSLDGQAMEAREARYRFFVPGVDGIVELHNLDRKRAFKAIDARRFAIEPNPSGQPPAAVRYKAINLARFRHFSARLRIVGPDAGVGLIFGFALESLDGAPAFAAEQIVDHGSVSEWRCELPELAGEFDAVLSVRPASENSNPRRISGVWIDAQLT